MPTTPPGRRLPLGVGTSDEAVEQQWTSKLLSDLQSSAADETVSATIAELKSTIEARDQRLSLQKPSEASARAQRAKELEEGAGKPATSDGLSLEVPQYDALSIDALQKAARSVAIPSEAKAPMPTLLRDMSDALSRQRDEHEKLVKRLAQLEPAVTNYNPSDENALTKAAEQVAEPLGSSAESTLPKLVKDMKSAIVRKRKEQSKMETRCGQSARTAADYGQRVLLARS